MPPKSSNNLLSLRLPSLQCLHDFSLRSMILQCGLNLLSPMTSLMDSLTLPLSMVLDCVFFLQYSSGIIAPACLHITVSFGLHRQACLLWSTNIFVVAKVAQVPDQGYLIMYAQVFQGLHPFPNQFGLCAALQKCFDCCLTVRPYFCSSVVNRFPWRPKFLDQSIETSSVASLCSERSV